MNQASTNYNASMNFQLALMVQRHQQLHSDSHYVMESSDASSWWSPNAVPHQVSYFPVDPPLNMTQTSSTNCGAV